jgi:prepilin-type N-terminal cleavage/methylation domain-containing protein/prepilin-type processing-associated H-X9-DG protein
VKVKSVRKMQPARYERKPQCGFTLIELLVVVAIIITLAALMFPIFAQAKEKARQSGCLSNLKQISRAMMMYAQDYDDMLPRDVTHQGELPASDPCSVLNPNGRIEARLWQYVREAAVFACPSDVTRGVTWDTASQVCARDGFGYPEYFCYRGDATRGKPASYGWNYWVFQIYIVDPQTGCSAAGTSYSAMVTAERKVMVADSRHTIAYPIELAFANYPGSSPFYADNVGKYWPQLGNRKGARIDPGQHTRHQMGQNVAFFDGSVRWLRYDAFTGASLTAIERKWFGE